MGQFHRFSAKSGTVLHVLYEEWDSSTGSLLRALRAKQFCRFSVKTGTVLQALCYKWDSSTRSFVNSKTVLQVPCEE